MNRDEHQTFQNTAISLLSEQMQSDPDYAWSWQCNLAMMAYDAGADHEQANRQAAQFMKNLFGVNIPIICPVEWGSLAEDWESKAL